MFHIGRVAKFAENMEHSIASKNRYRFYHIQFFRALPVTALLSGLQHLPLVYTLDQGQFCS